MEELNEKQFLFHVLIEFSNGLQGTKMDLEVYGNQSEVGYVNTNADFYPNDDDIVIKTFKMTPDEIMFPQRENGTRAQIRRIDDDM